MSHRLRLAPVLLCIALALPAHALDLPTQGTTASGIEYGAKALFQYDVNRFGNDRLETGAHRFDDEHGWRRRELAAFVRKSGVFDLTVGHDFAADAWIDNFFRINVGKSHEFRLGQFKTPVGMDDGATSSSATLFIERGMSESAIYQGRRIGADWTGSPGPHWRWNLGYFTGGDLNGANEGHTTAGRVVYTPWQESGELLHLGLAASREHRDDRTARVRARPEAGLTDVRLVDSGTLRDVEAIDRVGLEAALQHGPWLAQGEWLAVTARRDASADYRAHGGYVQGSWVITGEARPYKRGGFGNLRPTRASGAVEVGLRYSALDLDEGNVAGGRQHDWTLGANWYLGRHFKFQANYVRVHSDRQETQLSPEEFELRAQFAF